MNLINNIKRKCKKKKNKIRALRDIVKEQDNAITIMQEKIQNFEKVSIKSQPPKQQAEQQQKSTVVHKSKHKQMPTKQRSKKSIK